FKSWPWSRSKQKYSREDKRNKWWYFQNQAEDMRRDSSIRKDKICIVEITESIDRLVAMMD
ncbi:hypothetical protein BX616_002365, partial [Lobosporangium transversale]